MAFVHSFEEISVHRQELEAVKKVIQIQLVRSLKNLEEVEEELEDEQNSFWMKDLPVQRTIKDYRQAVADLLTIYTQLENTYDEYYKRLYNVMKAFDESKITEELTASFDAEMTRLHKQIEDLKADKHELATGFDIAYEELRNTLSNIKDEDLREELEESREVKMIEGAKKKVDKQKEKMKRELDSYEKDVEKADRKLAKARAKKEEK